MSTSTLYSPSWPPLVTVQPTNSNPCSSGCTALLPLDVLEPGITNVFGGNICDWCILEVWIRFLSLLSMKIQICISRFEKWQTPWLRTIWYNRDELGKLFRVSIHRLRVLWANTLRVVMHVLVRKLGGWQAVYRLNAKSRSWHLVIVLTSLPVYKEGLTAEVPTPDGD